MSAPALENTMLILYVDTNPPGGLTQENVENHVWLSDSNGDFVSGNNGIENYQTGISSGGLITIVGALENYSSNPSAYVIITNAIPVDPANRNKLQISQEPPGPPQSNKTYIQGRVTGNPGESIEYRLYFDLIVIEGNERQDPVSLSIDPKLEIH